MSRLLEIEKAEELTTLSVIDPRNPILKPFFGPRWQAGPWNFYLRLARSAENLTLPDLGRQTGLHPNYIHHFEAMRAWPNAGQAGKIAEALHIVPEEIFPPWLTFFVRPRAGSNNHQVWLEADEAIDPLAESLRREYLHTLRQAEITALNCLRPIDRQILVLNVIEELSVPKTAAVLGIRRRRVRERANKGLERLRNMKLLNPFA